MKSLPVVSRRKFMTLTAAGLTLANSAQVFAGSHEEATQEEAASGKTPAPISADQAWQDLLDGNARFVKGQPTGPRRSPEEFRALAEGQYPHAVIVSCADSRVAPEILFDVGVGDVFVVRIAGNVVGGAGVTVKGSIESAIAELKVPLIVVLGHSSCGAVKAAMMHIVPRIRCPVRSTASSN